MKIAFCQVKINNEKKMTELRQYQLEAIEKVKKSFQCGKKTPILVLPTGAGKTVIAAEIIRRTINKNNKVLFLTHRQEIMKQTLKKLYDFGIIAGQIASGKPLTRDFVQVGMIQTVANRLNVLRHKPDLIIADEYHHFIANNFLKVIKYFGHVPRLGLTATPERLDGRGLCEISDDLIIGTSVSELVRQGYLAYPRIYAADKTDIDYKLVRGEFDKTEQEKNMRRRFIVGDVIEHYKQHLKYNPAACFCISQDHMTFMQKEFNSANIKAVKVYSGMSDIERENALKGIADGTYNIILSVDILGEGVDVPGLHGVIMLRKTTSLALYLQQAGRALRLAENKDCAYILDHCGNTKIHGHVLIDRDWSLEHGKRNYKKDKLPRTSTCPKCFAVWPGEPQKCFDCGFVFAQKKEISDQQRKPLQIIEGELRELFPEGFTGMEDILKFASQTQSKNDKERGKAALAMAFKYQDRDAIKAIGQVLGYKKGWTNWAHEYVMRNKREK